MEKDVKNILDSMATECAHLQIENLKDQDPDSKDCIDTVQKPLTQKIMEKKQF